MKKVAIIIVLFLMYLLFIRFTQFTPILVFDNSGYLLGGNEISTNLTNEDRLKQPSIEGVKVNAFESLYRQNNNLFVGTTKKTEINPIYPMYSKDGSQIYNLSSDTALIDENFKYYTGYENFYVTSGAVYNHGDQERIDNRNYNFLRLSNNLYVNTLTMDVKTVLNKYTLPMNSIFNPTEKSLAYYVFDDGKFHYHRINDVDMETEITIHGLTYTYQKLLEEFGKMEKKKQNVTEEMQEIVTTTETVIEKKSAEKEAIKDEEETKPEKVYVKPTVNVESFTSSVYSITSNLKIKDPSKVITAPVQFEVRSDGKTYLKKGFVSSGKITISGLEPGKTYDIIGTFSYKDENDIEMIAKCLTQTITMKTFDELETMRLNYQNGQIYSDKIEIRDIQIQSDLKTESVRAIKKAGVLVNGIFYSFSTSERSALINGEKVNFQTPPSLPSSATCNYSIVFYDMFSNLLKIENNTGTTRTSKNRPKATIKVTKNEVTEVAFKVNLQNSDNLSIGNYRYAITNNAGSILTSGKLSEDGEFKITNFDPEEVYTVGVYGDYDVQDGKGVVRDQSLGEMRFTTSSISSLGYVNLNVEGKNISDHGLELSIGVNLEKTDARLLQFVTGVKLRIYENVGGKYVTVYEKLLDKEDRNQLITGAPITTIIDGLDSQTEYFVEIKSNVQQGNKKYVFDTINNYKNFKTLKLPAKVLIRNQFVMENLIDFDVKVEDFDGSITSDYIYVELRNQEDKIVDTKKLEVNDDYVRFTYDKLNRLEKYTFKYYVKEYNEGYTNATAKSNHVLLNQELFTAEGISGKVGLVSLLQEVSGATFQKYNADILINLKDTRKEIPTNDYYINIYKNDEFVQSDNYDMGGSTEVIDAIKKYKLDKKVKYRFELVVKIRDRFYTIASTSFTTEKEIRGIRTKDEFFAMKSSGKYILLNNLDFSNDGRNYGTFDGELDFQGYEVRINNKNRQAYLFHGLGISSVLQNVNLHIDLDNPIERYQFWGLNYRNWGKIQNIMLTYDSATQVGNVELTGITRENYGLIENFVVHNKVSIYGERMVSTAILYNRGTVRNGYLYGKPINVTFPTTTPGAQKETGGLIMDNNGNALVENIYSLINVNTVPNLVNNDRVANLIALSHRGVVKNVYSVGEGNNSNLNLGPTIAYSASTTSNIYYASDLVYNNTINNKISKLALKDYNFQDRVLNSQHKFNVDELVMAGYYPQLILPDCMPNQEVQPIPKTEDDDLVDITSLEVLESRTDTATAMLYVNNPGGEKITSIRVENLNLEVLSQEYLKGKSKVKVRLTNPKKYVSKYYVESISSVGAYNITYIRNYKQNERSLNIDMYRSVSTIKEWKNITTSRAENYELTADLDFKNATDFQIGDYSGKINGAGHTIKNIEITSGTGMFNTLSGEIKNLFIENYQKKNLSAYSSFIYQMNNTAVVDNVHMSKVRLKGNAAFGGIVGYVNGSFIQNSSVTDFQIEMDEDQVDVRVGPIAAQMDSGYILNCFSQDIDIRINNALSVSGVGGLVGYMYTGNIENAYSSGKIFNNSTHTGGIIGRGSVQITRVYSNVDIETELDFVGGIVGRNVDSVNYGVILNNNLSVGNIYSSYISNYFGRIIGNTAPNASTFALHSQLINGEVRDTTRGEQLVEYSELLDPSFYANIIGFEDNFYYDKADQAILPKLYNTDKKTKLPNQKDSSFKAEDFQIESINATKRISDGTILFTIKNPKNLQITGLTFDYFDVKKINKSVTVNGETTIEVIVAPNHYYDTYQLTGIKYLENGLEKSYQKSARIEMQFYHDIENFDDWQNIDPNTYENYRLVADIDFAGKLNVNTNLNLARLEGSDNGHTLKNLTIDFNKQRRALFSRITAQMKNVNFENITINNPSATGEITGIIGINYGLLNNLKFNKITINAPNISKVGVIAINNAPNNNNLQLSNLVVKGLDFTGGLVGWSEPYQYSNVTLRVATVTGRTYVGGLIGHRPYQWATNATNFTVEDVNITGTGDNVGGLAGYGGASNTIVRRATVKGRSNVGGVGGGHSSFGQPWNIQVIDSDISGSGNTIGGAFGYAYYFYDVYVRNTKIRGTTANSIYVGGLCGNFAYTQESSGVVDSEISSPGSSVGGLIGISTGETAVVNAYVLNTTVTGSSNVGGAIGYQRGPDLRDIYINATVRATGSNAGGLVGYLNNQDMTNASNVSSFYRGMTLGTTVTAADNAGGLIGKMDKNFYLSTGQTKSPHFFSLYSGGNVHLNNNNSGKASATVGSNPEQAKIINNLRVYDKSTVKDSYVDTIQASEFLSSENLWNASQLSLPSTYTNAGFTATYWNYTPVSSGNYPFLKRNGGGADVSYQRKIALPVSASNLTARARNLSLARLPKVESYSSGANLINIEFDTIDPTSTYKIKDETKTTQEQPITSRVVTLEYDYQKPFTIIIDNGINTEQTEIHPKDIRRLASVYQEEYYYYKDKTIHKKDGNTSKGTYLNLYQDQALKDDRKVYDIKTMKEVHDTTNFKIAPTSPLFTFQDEDTIVETFKDFSLVSKGETTSLKELQLLKKDGTMQALDAYTPAIAYSVIIDKYNEKEYLTIVDESHIITNLKSSIKLPDKFKNQDIESITNNLSTDQSIMIVTYLDGGTIGIDYRTGEIIFSDLVKKKTSFSNYISNFFSARSKPTIEPSKESYEKAQQLEEKIKDTPLKNLLEGKEWVENPNLDNFQENNDIKNPDSNEEKQPDKKEYMTVYDTIKQQYVVYDTQEVLDTSKPDLISETDKINKNTDLIDFYQGKGKGTQIVSLDGIKIVILLFSIIIASVVYLYVKGTIINKKNESN